MANRTYSFQDTKMSITGPGGSFSIKDGSDEGGLTISFRDDKSTLTMGADGSWMHSLHAAKDGTVTVRLLKNSPVNAILSGLYNFQQTSSKLWGQNTLVVTSSVGDVITCTGGAFKKAPDVTYAKEGQAMEWTFDFGSVSEVLAASVL